MTEREKILGRIREALAVASAAPGHAHAPDVGRRSEAPRPLPQEESPGEARPFSYYLPAVPSNPEDRLALFRTKVAELRADFHLAGSREQLRGLLLALRDSEHWKKVAAHRGELADFATGTLGLPLCLIAPGYSVNELETCDAGITECDALVAQTGSVLVTSRSAGGRALSVLPPHHIVLARRAQLVADLPEAFTLLKRTYGSGYPSFISFITGPSRTGDIERILVLGAHGPKKLTICCLA